MLSFVVSEGLHRKPLSLSLSCRRNPLIMTVVLEEEYRFRVRLGLLNKEETLRAAPLPLLGSKWL